MEPIQVFNPPSQQSIEEINNTIVNLNWELITNYNLIENHLQMQIYSQFEREKLSTELYKVRLEALVASSRSQLNDLRRREWEMWNAQNKWRRVNNRNQYYHNTAKSNYPPIQKTINKRNRNRKGKGSKFIPTQYKKYYVEPVKTVTAPTNSTALDNISKAIPSQIKNNVQPVKTVTAPTKSTALNTIAKDKGPKCIPSQINKNNVGPVKTVTAPTISTALEKVSKPAETINPSLSETCKQRVGKSGPISTSGLQLLQVKKEVLSSSSSETQTIPTLLTINLSPIKKEPKREPLSFIYDDYMVDELEEHL